MKTTIQMVMIFAAVIAMVFGVMYAMRLFSNATTPITLHSPKAGVTCAAMVTGDGTAISCWKD